MSASERQEKALRVLEELLTSDSESVRLAAARGILDRSAREAAGGPAGSPGDRKSDVVKLELSWPEPEQSAA